MIIQTLQYHNMAVNDCPGKLMFKIYMTVDQIPLINLFTYHLGHDMITCGLEMEIFLCHEIAYCCNCGQQLQVVQ